MQFHNDKFANPAGLVEFLNANKGVARIKDNKVQLMRDWPTEADRIKGAFGIARDLAEKVVDAERAAKKPEASARKDREINRKLPFFLAKILSGGAGGRQPPAARRASPTSGSTASSPRPPRTAPRSRSSAAPACR